MYQMDQCNIPSILDELLIDINIHNKSVELSAPNYTTECGELLFKHNKKSFNGSREIVYDTIFLFNEIKDYVDDDDSVSLEGNLPGEIINRYIDSSYIKSFSLDSIELNYFNNF